MRHKTLESKRYLDTADGVLQLNNWVLLHHQTGSLATAIALRLLHTIANYFLKTFKKGLYGAE